MPALRPPWTSASRCRLRSRGPSCWRTGDCSRAGCRRPARTPTACWSTEARPGMRCRCGRRPRRRNRRRRSRSSWRADNRDRRLGGLGRQDGNKRLGRELVANAGVAGPAVDIIAITIIDAHEAEPAGIHDLPGEAERILPIGTDAGRRRCLVERKGRAAGPRRIAFQRGVVRGDVAGEFVEHACRREGLPDHCRGRDGLADPHRGAADLAYDVIGLNDAGDAGEVGAGDAGRGKADQPRWWNR